MAPIGAADRSGVQQRLRHAAHPDTITDGTSTECVAQLATIPAHRVPPFTHSWDAASPDDADIGHSLPAAGRVAVAQGRRRITRTTFHDASSRRTGTRDTQGRPPRVVTGVHRDEIDVRATPRPAHGGARPDREERLAEAVLRLLPRPAPVTARGPVSTEEVPRRRLVAAPRRPPRRERQVDHAARFRHPHHLRGHPPRVRHMLQHVRRVATSTAADRIGSSSPLARTVPGSVAPRGDEFTRVRLQSDVDGAPPPGRHRRNSPARRPRRAPSAPRGRTTARAPPRNPRPGRRRSLPGWSAPAGRPGTAAPSARVWPSDPFPCAPFWTRAVAVTASPQNVMG